MVWFCYLDRFMCFVWCHPLTETLPLINIYIRLCTLLQHITYQFNIYTCVTPCIFTCNYLWCLNACQWQCGLQTFFRTWVTRVSMLTYLIIWLTDIITRFSSVLLHNTLLSQYNRTGCEMFALNPFITLPNRGPPPSLNHRNTLPDMPTYHLLSLLSVWSFFLRYAS